LLRYGQLWSGSPLPNPPPVKTHRWTLVIWPNEHGIAVTGAISSIVNQMITIVLPGPVTQEIEVNVN